MKKTIAVLTIVIAAIFGIYYFTAKGADTSGTTTTGLQTYEFATIRWAGRDNTYLIRPSGKVEVLGALLGRVQRPDRADDRAFYMNVAMNAVGKEGYEFAGMTPDEIVMKRPVTR